MIVFTNSALGLAYEYKSDAPEADELAAMALPYPELVVPKQGLLITAGVDVQHDRFAVILRAWGRDEESWLIYWNEINGNVMDKSDPVWIALENDCLPPSVMKVALSFCFQRSVSTAQMVRRLTTFITGLERCRPNIGRHW